MAVGGTMGQILVVNLTTGEITPQAIPDRIYEQVLSGVGLGAWYIYENIPAGADALGPENVLGLTSGLLTGTGTFMTGRFMAVCKSPLTGAIGEANCGGDFAPNIKQSGYDAIFFHGISEKPVYLLVSMKGAELRDASDLWGTADAVDTELLLQERHQLNGKKPGVACIGEAGERCSLMAGISNGGGRIAARSGVGAVMGSKRLKAVVCIGNKPIPCHDFEAQKRYSATFAKKCKNINLPQIGYNRILSLMGVSMAHLPNSMVLDGAALIALYKQVGTTISNTMSVPNGDTPVKNWGGTVKDFPWSQYKHLGADRYREREISKYHCVGCGIGCGGVYDIHDIRDGKYPHTHKPEYETAAGFGHLILNKNLEDIFYINEVLNRAGIDSIGAANASAMAIECCEHGLIPEELLEGHRLSWGDTDSILWFLDRLIRREGLGAVFADGLRGAVETLGEAAAPYAVHVSGQAVAMHDPKADPLLGVHYVTDPSPGKHTIGMALTYGTMALWREVSWAPKASLTDPRKDEFAPTEREALKSVAASAYKLLTDAVGGCMFGMATGLKHWNLFTMLNNATGWGRSADQYMEIGKRINTIRQLFNIKHGIDPRTFKMHPRMKGEPPLTKGALKGITLEIEEMTRQHWLAYGYDGETGVPTQATLDALGIGELLTLEEA